MKGIQRLQTLLSAILLPVAAHSAIVGIDDFHSSGILASGFLFSEFRETITNAGHTIVPLASFTSDSLLGLDALIIVQADATSFNYTAGEIAAIQSFVAAGHGLIASGEAGNTSDNTVANFNTLVAPFGVTFGPVGVGGSGLTITGFSAHALTMGVSTLGVDFARPMTVIQSPAVDLTFDGGSSEILAAVTGTGGQGNIVFLGDTSLWSNSVPPVGDRPISFGDNRRLLQNAIGYVVPEPGTALLGVGLLAVVCQRTRRPRR